MEAHMEPSEPIGAVYEEGPLYSPPPNYHRPGHRTLPSEVDNTCPQEQQARYERSNEVHVGPAGAPTAPTSREPSAPVMGGAEHAPARVIPVEEEEGEEAAPQPVANVAIIAALNNQAAIRQRIHGQVLRHRADSLSDGDGSEYNDSGESVTFSEWEQESSSEEEFE